MNIIHILNLIVDLIIILFIILLLHEKHNFWRKLVFLNTPQYYIIHILIYNLIIDPIFILFFIL